MSDTVTLHLVRHGESLWNVEGRYQGDADSGLSEYGRGQAELFGAAFAAEVPAPDLVVSSDLPRVRDTAAPYAERVGAEVRIDPALREMSVGDWAGLSFEEARAAHPEVVAAVEAGADIARGVGGETFSQTRERVVAALERALAAVTGRDGHRLVVVFTSGNPIRLATAQLLGVPSPGHMPFSAPGNCSITTFRLRDGRGELVRFNHDIAPARPADQREIS
ncbi:MAG: histidine phosphatase family protein [Protaetiibacter sp.]